MNPPTEQKTSSTVSIDDLPPEIISECFKKLSLKDLATCSLVDKRWQSIYAAFKLNQLFVTDNPENPRKWYDSNQPIPVESVCRLKTFTCLAEKPLLSDLKHLAIVGGYFEFDLNELNRFQQLVHLEICTASFDREKVYLKLPKLKVLVWNFNWPVSIDCPELSTLVYAGEEASQLEVEHPETIRKLQTYMIGEKLAPFKSVESLVTENFEAINKATLLSLPALKELCYDRSIEFVFQMESREGVGTINRMKRKLSEFLDEVKTLRGSDFRFTFAGLQLTNVKLGQIDFGVQVDGRIERVSNEYVYMKNYHLIEPGALHFISGVEYPDLASNLTGEFPHCFSQKFTGIEWVSATAEVQDADRFLSFLKSLRSLGRLGLVNTGLSQEFYDQLPASASSLRRFVLAEYWTNELKLNFDFLAELSGLSELGIHTPLCFKSLPSVVRSLGRLGPQIEECSFYVQLSKGNVLIEKTRERGLDWNIIKDETVLFKTKNPDEIVNFIEGLKAGRNDMPEASCF